MRSSDAIKKFYLSHKKKIIWTLIIIFVVYLYLLYYFDFHNSPILGQITADSPVKQFLCNLYTPCVNVEMFYPCYVGFYINNEDLERWDGYKGCNVSTPGFVEGESGDKGISVEGCGCRGIS